MEPGVLVDAIGSTSPFLREIDTETLRKYERTKVVDLKEVLVGQARGRTDPRQMVLFKSVGTAVQDVMAGFVVYRAALAQGRGREVGEFLELETF